MRWSETVERSRVKGCANRYIQNTHAATTIMSMFRADLHIFGKKLRRLPHRGRLGNKFSVYFYKRTKAKFSILFVTRPKILADASKTAFSVVSKYGQNLAPATYNHILFSRAGLFQPSRLLQMDSLSNDFLHLYVRPKRTGNGRKKRTDVN